MLKIIMLKIIMLKKTAEVLKDYPEVKYKLIRAHHRGLPLKQREKVDNNIPDAKK